MHFNIETVHTERKGEKQTTGVPWGPWLATLQVATPSCIP